MGRSVGSIGSGRRAGRSIGSRRRAGRSVGSGGADGQVRKGAARARTPGPVVEMGVAAGGKPGPQQAKTTVKT